MMANFFTDIEIQAPVEQVWEILSDVGTISRWNPGIVDSYNTSDEIGGLGATRYCDLGGKNYLNEEVVDWERCERLTMRIVGTNMPFKRADIHFTLHGDNGTTIVTVSPDYELKYGLLGQAMDRFYVRSTYERGMDNLLRGLKEYVEEGKGDPVVEQPLTLQTENEGAT